MSYTSRGRHRAPRRLTPARLTRAGAVTAASVGLMVSMTGGAQAATPSVPAASPTGKTVSALPTLPLPSHPTTTTVRWGSRGGVVESVQAIVGANADGIFGPVTHAAVKRWQSRNGLVADGIVGPLTSRAMGLNAASSDARAQPSASRSSSRSSSSSSSGVLRYAQQYTGIMYSWGGTSPSTGFDCSGYTQYVYAKVGVDLPRTAEAQRQATTPVSEPRPGDMVFWGAPAWHNAIYAGDGMIYDSGKPGIPTQKRKMFSGVTSYGRVG